MLSFLAALAYPLLTLPSYLAWSRRQIEGQIDKMQAAVFNTPGAEAPVPPAVAVAGLGWLAGYGMVTAWLGIRGWRRALALVAGVSLGSAVYVLRSRAPQR
jgi:hypothetical protein